MRIGIDLAFLLLGPAAMKRGIPRFTLRQIAETVRMGHEHDFVLFYDEGSSVSSLPRDILEASNVSLVAGPARCDPMGDIPADAGAALRHGEDRQASVRRCRVDVYHSPTPAITCLPVFGSWDVCPVVANFYDAIPLLYPEHYFGEAGGEPTYSRALAFLRQATRVVAISEVARREATVHLGVAAERIDVAHPVAEPVFRPLPRSEIAAALAPLRERVSLPSRYALSVAAIHHTKNLDTLLRAYALLEPRVREGLPLVVCCELDGRFEDALRGLVRKEGLEDDVVLSGFVSDEELVGLYCGAMMLLHPSRHEGFGLPVLEAMTCGTPVIAARAGAIPEVGGDAILGLDASDPDAWARGIEAVYAEPAVRRDMSERGRVRAATFRPESLGEATLASYRRAASGAGRARGGPRQSRRVALWSPFPPVEGDAARHGASLALALGSRYDVEVFVGDGVVPPADVLARHRVHHWSAFPRRHTDAPFDATLYTVGSSPHHLFVGDALRRWPGILVVQDLGWSRLLQRTGSNPGGAVPFRAELGRLEGSEAVREYDEVLAGAEGQGSLDAFLTEHLMLGEAIAASRAVVVHSEVAAQTLRSHYPGARPVVVPIGIPDPLGARRDLEALQAKDELGIGAETFVVNLLGPAAPTERLLRWLAALRSLLEIRADSLLLLAETAVEGRGDEILAEAVRLGVGDRARLVPADGGRRTRASLLAADVVSDLRFPLPGEMPTSAMTALAAGKPVVLAAVSGWDHLPGGACFRVPADEREGVLLGAVWRVLASDEAARTAVAHRARAWFEEHGTIETMVAAWAAVVDGITTTAREIPA